ncbi:MAG TPA: nitrilase-related carbon-nitrogen hydrolase [Alloacidobacterium sp.]|nr:nitrilase-related carbon-nitrogen hydrolase [Alloacidobacterium sp.]
MDLKPNNHAIVAFCLGLSAMFFFFGTGLTPAWPFLWLAPIPVLWIVPRLSAGTGFLVAAVAYAIGSFNVWHYLTAVIPVWLALINSIVPACIFGLAVLLFRSRILKGKLWQAACIVPIVWVVYEYLTSIISIHGTIGNVSYSQMNFLPVLQIASVTGIWGISFSVFLFAATVAALFGSGPQRQKQMLAAASVIYLLAVFGYGIWRLAATPKDSPTIKVGLIASDDSMNLVVPTTDAAAQEFDRFGAQMLSMASQGIQLFVLPEHSGPVTDATVAATDATFENLARRTHAFIAIGIDRISPTISRNQERVYAPNGTLLATYDKHHLLPHWEDQFTPSTSRTALSVPYGAMCAGPDAKSTPASVSALSGKWGLEICKDMDFPKLSRQYARDGVALMVVPAWDFSLDGWSHGRIGVMRAVEGGFSVARSAKKSILYATDDRGHVLAERNTDFVPYATVVTNVPVRHDKTLYSICGDWFAWLNIALLLCLLCMPLIEHN